MRLSGWSRVFLCLIVMVTSLSVGLTVWVLGRELRSLFG